VFRRENFERVSGAGCREGGCEQDQKDRADEHERDLAQTNVEVKGHFAARAVILTAPVPKLDSLLQSRCFEDMNGTFCLLVWRGWVVQSPCFLNGHRSLLQTALSLCLVLGLLPGCSKSSSGLASNGDYAYAADTPEQVAKGRARFDSAVKLFESVGMRATSVNRSDKRSEATLTAAGTEARVTLEFPDNGFATITLAYKFEGTEAKAKAEAESVLARAQAILSPDQAPPPGK